MSISGATLHVLLTKPSVGSDVALEPVASFGTEALAAVVAVAWKNSESGLPREVQCHLNKVN